MVSRVTRDSAKFSVRNDETIAKASGHANLSTIYRTVIYEQDQRRSL